jgi:hypothetical protein
MNPEATLIREPNPPKVPKSEEMKYFSMIVLSLQNFVENFTQIMGEK